jgi:hypothetical protein
MAKSSGSRLGLSGKIAKSGLYICAQSLWSLVAAVLPAK